MDLDRFSVFVYVIMICQIGDTFPSSGGSCPCAEIPKWSNTEPPENQCSENGNRFRYQCIQGYVRKVGTSNLITCNLTDLKWTKPTLHCIADPKLPRQPTTTSAKPKTPSQATTTSPNPESHSSTPHDSISTTTVKTSTSPQSEKPSTSPTGSTNNTMATSQGTYTTVPCCAIQNASSLSRTHNETRISNPGAYTGIIAQTVGIGSSVVILICALLAITFLLYRRRNRIPTRTKEEMEPMNTLHATAS